MLNVHPRLFNFLVLIGCLGFVGAASGLTYFVDPYAIYRTDPYHEAEKQGVEGQLRLHRAHALRQVDADALLLGTSRTLYGLDPLHPRLTERSTRPYNSAFSNGSFYEGVRYLQHAHATSPVKFAVVELGLLSFDTNNALGRAGFAEDRLVVSYEGEAQDQPWVDLGPTLLSLDALKQSVKTLRPQRPHLLGEAGAGRLEALMQTSFQPGGIREIFKGAESFYLHRYSCLWVKQEDGTSRSLAVLEELLDFAREEGIDLYFYFPPVHARMLLTIREAQLWSMLADLKMEAMRLVEEDGRERGREPFVVLDFMSAAGFAAEEVPRDPKLQLTEHYVDSSHFSREVGGWVLERLLGGNGRDDFGTSLHGSNVAEVHERLTQELDAYVTSHPSDAAEVRASAEKHLKPGWRSRCRR